MSDENEGYCRLCAESRQLSEMLSPDKDIVTNSKIITKLSWINIDISTTDGLPNTICYTCLNLLERTWTFLNNVRSAQEKLSAIFVNTRTERAKGKDVTNKDSNPVIPGKPVDENWEIFQELKREIKIENLNDDVPTLPLSEAVAIAHDIQSDIKCEAIISDADNDGYNSHDDLDGYSSDSDVPLKKCAKKKRGRPARKKSRLSFNAPISWDNQACMCAKCDATCESIPLLQLHSLRIHDACGIFKCVECSKVFNGYRSFIRHVRMHNKDLRHCCEFCNNTFKHLSDLSSHKMKHHKMIYKTKCFNCGSSFDTPNELEEHRNLFSKNVKLKKITTDNHMEFKCDQCNKVCKSRPNLSQHILNMHTERTKDFACHICGKTFYTKGTLRTHMDVHEEKRPFKCSHCPLAFRAKGNLLSHMSLHSGLKPFICEQCGQSFRVKRHLISHSIVHTDLRPFVCEYCNKSFRFKTRLNLHLRQHTGVRPYKCVYCQRDFTNGSNHKKHMKRRHGIDTSTRLVSKVVSKKESEAISQ